MRHRLLIPLLLLLLLPTLTAVPIPAHAQESDVCDTDHFDFWWGQSAPLPDPSTVIGTVTINHGTFRDYNVSNDQPAGIEGFGYAEGYVDVSWELPATVAVTQISFRGGANSHYGEQLYLDGMTVIDDTGAPLLGVGEQVRIYTPEEPVSVTTIRIVYIADTTWAFADAIFEQMQVQFTDCVPTDLHKPLTEADLNHSLRNGLFDVSADDQYTSLSPDYYQVNALSNSPGDDVYAVADGEVLDIRDPNTFSCADAGLAEIWGTCILEFDPEPGDSLNSGHVYRIDISNAYLIIVSFGSDDEVLRYVVEAAPQYVTVGQNLHAGCILGKTTTLIAYTFTPAIPNLGLSSPDANKGIAFVELFIDQTDLIGANGRPLVGRLTESTDPGQACNAVPELATCMGTNPRFLNGTGWNIRGTSSVIFPPGGGVTLNPGAEIYEQLNLNGETGYTVTAGGLNLLFEGVPTDLLLRIGTQSDTFPVSATTETVALEDITPNDGTLIYEVGIKNVGNGGVFIDWLCITDGNPPQNPHACYFQNPSFDFDGSSWSVGNGIGPFIGDGTALMLDTSDATLAQAVDLEPGDYSLSARVRPFYSVATNLVESPAGNIDLFYDFAGETNVLDNFSWIGADPGWQILTATFTLSDQTSGNMTFSLDINSGSEELQGLQIDRFCLSRDGGYTPPGTGYPPPFNESCEAVANPLTTDVPSWIAWHWAQLRRFYICDLMVLLNTQYLYLTTTGDTVLRSIRYFIASAQYEASWFGSQLIPWLGGYLNNIALGRTTIIATENQQCDNIFCAIVAGYDLGRDLIDRVLGIVETVVDFFNDVARAIFSIFLSLFGRAVGLVTNVAVGADRFVNAWNHANQPIDLTGDPLLPDGGSQTPTETANSFLDRFNTWVASTACGVSPRTKPGCITLWLFENTVFSGDRKVILWFICANALGGWWYWSIRRGKAIVEKLARNL